MCAGRSCTLSRNPAPKSKWGRHCCRPHSYQRVVAWVIACQSGKPSRHAVSKQARLALGVCAASSCAFQFMHSSLRRIAFPLLHRLASRFVTGARTGIRPCFVTTSLCSRRNAPFGTWPLVKAETAILVIGKSNTDVPDSKVFPNNYHQPALWPSNESALRSFLKQSNSHQTLVFQPQPFACPLSDSAWTNVSAIYFT